MIHSYYGILARIPTGDGIYIYRLRLPDYHEAYGVPDIDYSSLQIAKKEAIIVLYNNIRLLSNIGNNLPHPMSPPTIHTHAQRWFDDEGWDRANYKGCILIKLKATDMDWVKGILPLQPPNQNHYKTDIWKNLMHEHNLSGILPVLNYPIKDGDDEEIIQYKP